jgi:hypothetical protein
VIRRLGAIVGLSVALPACDLGRDASPPDGVPPDADPVFPYPPPRDDLVPPIGGDATFEIATWNVENFPATIDTPSVVADVIASLDLDVVVLEEIASVAAWDELVLRLRDHDGVLSTHEYTPDSYQKIGVIYRSSMVAAGAPTLLFGNDGWAFPRPAFAIPLAVDGWTFDVIGIHLKAGVGYEDGERRRLAIEALDGHLRTQIDGGGEDDVFVVGDYNEVLDTAEGQTVLAGFHAAPDRYTIHTAPAALAGEVSFLGFGGKLIDHVTSTTALAADLAGATLTIPRLDQSIGGYTGAISDHLPVILVAPR